MGAVGSLLMIVGFIAGEASGNEDSALYMMAIVGIILLAGTVYIWTSGSNDEEYFSEADIVVMPAEIVNSVRKDYRVIEQILSGVGFTNIRCIALKDLTTGWITKPGMVQSVTAGGKPVTAGKKYHVDIPIVISYHSFNSDK